MSSVTPINDVTHSNLPFMQIMPNAGYFGSLINSGEESKRASLDGGLRPYQGFQEIFAKSLHNVDALQHTALKKMDAVERGTSDDLLGAMLASQDAALSFSMLSQVRNKLLGAFDDLLKMPI